MILSDTDIQQRLTEFGLTSPDPGAPFDADHQLGSCSIDLRLSPTIWLPRRFRALDLSTKNPWGAAISNAFRQRSIGERGVWLRPGGFFLGRTLESFQVPADLVGRLTGRSSLGRLGISVVAPSDFINPGWRGHMPLMVINHSPFWVRIYATLSVVQLCFIRLSSMPTRPYGAETGAKYQDDEGGPSRYWLDWSVKLLKQRLDAKTVDAEQESALARVAAELDEPTRHRFARALRAYGTVSDIDDFVEFFARRERRRSSRLSLLPWLLSIPTALILRYAIDWWHLGIGGKAAIILILAAALCAAYWLYRENSRTAFTPNDIRRMARDARSQSTSIGSGGASAK